MRIRLVTDRIVPGGKWQGVDRPLVLITLALIGVGLLLIYSADHALDNSSHFERQLEFAVVGFVLMIVTALIPTRFYFAGAYILYGVTLFFLLLVPIIGVSALGATRWISIFGFNFQPSEPAKVAFLIAAARYLSGIRPDQSESRALVGTIALAIGPAILVLTQPDLGTSSLFPVISAMLLAWWGLPLWYYVMAALPAAAMFLMSIPLVIVPFQLTGFWWMRHARMSWWGLGGLAGVCVLAMFSAPMAWNKLEPYQQRRLTTFLDPTADPLGSGYHVIQSKVAIGSGGFVGSGYLQGTQTQLRFVPQQHTDFIFALAGEEFGLLGTTTVIGLYFLYGWRGIRIAFRARSDFAGLVAAGITTMIIYHAAVNIGMAVGFLPVTGIPLPFLSYGGSFLITCMINTGVLLSTGIYRRE
jgi:rod shape determining protein RodA